MDVTFCQWFPSASRTMILYMLFRQWKTRFFNGQNPVITAIVIALGTYCNLYFSADHAQQTIHGLLQAFSGSRFQASDQRYYQVASVGRITANNEACSYYAGSKCAKHLNQTYKGLQGEGVVDPGSVK